MVLNHVIWINYLGTPWSTCSLFIALRKCSLRIDCLIVVFDRSSIEVGCKHIVTLRIASSMAM